MAWYDWFSGFYDSSLEQLYAAARQRAAESLQLDSAQRVLDVPTGTGQSLDALLPLLPDTAQVVAVDLSEGMLRRAKRRAERGGHAQRIEFRCGDALTLADVGAIDRLHVFLGLTAMNNYAEVFEHLWSLLQPGGLAVVVDVHSESLGLQGHLVNLVARADIRRRVWEPLQARAEDYERSELPADARYGGTLWLARGRKPKL